MFSAWPDCSGELAELRIEVPHWLATVSVLDNDLQPVPFTERVVKVDDDPFVGRLDLKLPPGAYQVQASMDGKTQSKWVIAETDAPTIIGAGTWTELRIESAMPMPAAAPAAVADDYLAEVAARRTASFTGEASARLSLFGTMLVAQPDAALVGPEREFDFDVAILDLDGQVRIDLRDASVERYVEPGRLWHCLIDSQPGPYTLRARVPASRSPVGAPPQHRCQPLFLCSGMAHHLFFRCDGAADLATLTMHVTRVGTGYDPLLPEAVAADAVLTALAHGDAKRLVLGSETLAQLLRGEATNPWLGVLAAYALLSGPMDDDAQAIVDEILAYLARGPLLDHPDVQVLMLGAGMLAGPIALPPMLLAAMRRLQRLAVERSGVIAPESPLDRLSARLIADTAWTAWLEVDAPAPVAAAAPPAPAGSALPPPIPAFVNAFPESAPVFPLTAVEPLPPEEVIPQNATLADHAAIIEAASHALEKACSTGLCGVEVQLEGRGRTLLDLSPEEVSRLTGTPLDVATKDLELLRTTQTSIADPAALERPLQLLAGAILGKQAQAAATQVEEGQPSVPPSPPEAQARRLGDAAARLRRIASLVAPEHAGAVAGLVADLEAVAENMISRAHLVILADDQGRLRYGNRLLRDRLEAREEGAAAVLERMARVFNAQSDNVLVVNAAELSPTSPEGRAGTEVEIQRTILSDRGRLIGYIYLLRSLAFPTVDRPTARRIDEILPLITLSASALEFAEPSEQAEQIRELRDLADELLELLLPARAERSPRPADQRASLR